MKSPHLFVPYFFSKGLLPPVFNHVKFTTNYGLNSFLLAAFTNLNAPNMLPWSVGQWLVDPSLAAFVIKESMSEAPSSKENWV